MTDSTATQRWPVEFVVERGKCLELARALRAEGSPYLPQLEADGQSGQPLPAVPTFPVVANHWGWSNARVLEDLGCEIPRVLHGSEEYEFPNGPLREGQRLRGAMRLVEQQSKTSSSGKKMTSFRFETELVDRDTGEVAALIRREVLEMGR